MKVLILTHNADIDGLGSIVLGKIAFGNIDYSLEPNIYDLEKDFRAKLESGELYNYDKIFITDLALANPSLDMVNSDSILKNKVVVLDHHKTSYDLGYGKYDFTLIQERDEAGNLRCGTDLFYEYLYKNGYLTRTSILDDFAELTRLADTWEWKKAGKKGELAADLAVLFNGIGINNYISSMVEKINSKDEYIELNDNEKRIVKEKRLEYETMMHNLWNEMLFFNDEFGNKYGIVYASHEYAGSLSEYIRSLSDKKGIKYVITVDLDKGKFGQKSYRSIDETFDVSAIAVLHGGGGHPQASGVNLTEEQKGKVLTLKRNDALKFIADSKYKM